MKAHIWCLGECLCEWTSVHPYVGISEPPVPLPNGHQLKTVQCSPGHPQRLDTTRMTTTGPHTQRNGAPPQPLPGARPPSWQRTAKLPFPPGPRGKMGRVGWRGAQEGHPAGPPAICVSAPLSPTSPLSLRVHHLVTPENWKLIFHDH